MRPFFDSDIVINFTLSEEAIQREKRIVENNRRVLRDCQKEKLILEGKKNWDKFYNHYKTNFFKDRKWIKVEFDHIFKKEITAEEQKNNEDGQKEENVTKEEKLILEIGCGVGNTLIPLLLEYPDYSFIGIDFSKNAINLLNEKWGEIVNMHNKLKREEHEKVLDVHNGSYLGDTERAENRNCNIVVNSVFFPEGGVADGMCNLDGCDNDGGADEDDDISERSPTGAHFFELWNYKKLGNLVRTCVVDITTDEEASASVCDFGTVDVVLLIYVLSSVQPDKMKNVIYNSYKYLKRGGYVLLRDYGLYDLTQVRFANKREKKISENFYVRGDKTFVYFFKIEELHNLFCQNGLFEEIENKYITRIVKNRKRKLEMKRIWVQSIFRKK
ncbi:methyltransferase, putative [Plasmodium ovale]|uniref:tRNA N(3)-methylcytidine methyltransferase n=2 Tax=Plasmodium ovale TaxID=36330 RepID=A0A1A8WB48_PLAOA|nr:methyltransferase, putative [Plasmodium ovale curtisi]SBS98655.1 methyltransferase, putative [Plasmodium ovale curtisi]SCQ17282.1 methyltransferase, putative [Plasmodium ovale]